MGSYLASGTQYSNLSVSTFAPGKLDWGSDFVAQNITSTGQGVLGGGIGFAGTGVAASVIPVISSEVIVYTAVTGLVFTIGLENSGNSASSTPSIFKVIDAGGVQATQNVMVTGLSGVKINGSTSAITLATNYGVKTFMQVPIVPTGSNQTATNNNWISF